MKIGDRVFVRGYIDEIRKDTVIVRNDGGYFGTVLSEVTGELPSAQPETNCSEFPNNSDTISRQAAIDTLRAMQTYKLFAGDDMLLIDQAGAQTELMMLPPAQPEPSQVAKDIARIVENGQDMRVIAQPEIIRCKDCKHWIPYDWMFSEVWRSKNMADYPEDEIGCNLCDVTMKANDFCSRAEMIEVTE